jgi:ribonucleoside-diphosphate reductase alpha chain
MYTCKFELENGEVITKEVDATKLFNKLAENNWRMGEPGILFWDSIENYNLMSEDEDFKYAGVNPCAEEPLPDGGSCLLGSFNLSAYVDDGKFCSQEFKNDIHTVVKAMNDVLDEGLPLHPLQIQRNTVRDLRQIGIGIMGIADMLIKMEIKYDSEEALKLCDFIGWLLADESIKASALLAKEYGAFPKCKIDKILQSDYFINNANEETYNLVSEYGLRNSQILTIAPTGTLSTMLGISGGIEPIFNLSYNRLTKSLHGEDVVYKVFTPIVKEYMEKHGLENEEDLPDFFVTAQTINPFMRVKIQGAWQRHIDASISSTINLPNEATVELVENLYKAAWKEGLKGLTIFRDGCERVAILTSGTDKKEEKEEEKVVVEEGLKRGQWEQKPKGCIEIPRKIYSGCGKELLHITIYPKEKRIIDFYITSSSSGGCKLNIQALAIAMSGMLRLGGNIQNIKCAFRGMGQCPSFVKARAIGKHVSKGTSCPTAILNMLMEVQGQLENECLPELQELGYYDRKVEMTEDVKVESNFTPIDLNIKKEKFTKEEKQYIKENGEVAFAQAFNKCPKCASKIEHVGGCMQCMDCGFTKCD